MAPLGKWPKGLQTSRRNLFRMSAILVSAIIAKAPSAMADDVGRGNFDRDRHRWWWNRDRAWDRDERRARDFRCFLRGTKILTAKGEKKIEDLVVGDLLPTVFGGVTPVQWIGRYRFRRSNPNKEWVRDVLPVRVVRSALGPNVPHSDLFVTRTHALLIDGILIAAGSLINGTTIKYHDPREIDDLEFFHIKLERHDVIYAEGTPCETLLNVDDNAINFAEYRRQYGMAPTSETPCAPLFRYNDRRGEIKSCFRSAVSPWIDRREAADIIRDRLDARGISLSRHPELAS